MMNVVWLISTAPLSLLQIFLVLLLRSVSLASLAWWQLAALFVDFQVHLCSRIVIMSISLVTLPVRILTALQQEAKLERLLSESRVVLENLMHENREIEERLQAVIRDREVTDALYDELEEEHEQALAKIDLLEKQVLQLKEENMRLNEIRGKTIWGFREGDVERVNPCEPWLTTTYKSKSNLVPEESWETDDKGKYQQGQQMFKIADSRDPTTTGEVIEALEKQRIIALSRSLFSALLSLVVGMIILEAEDPCAPLVAALFMVVGMSLGSVLEFFSTIKNKPASAAVALLSLNCFLLGALTSPTLPTIASLLTPKAIRFLDNLLMWLGFSFSTTTTS